VPFAQYTVHEAACVESRVSMLRTVIGGAAAGVPPDDARPAELFMHPMRSAAGPRSSVGGGRGYGSGPVPGIPLDAPIPVGIPVGQVGGGALAMAMGLVPPGLLADSPAHAAAVPTARRMSGRSGSGSRSGAGSRGSTGSAFNPYAATGAPPPPLPPPPQTAMPPPPSSQATAAATAAPKTVGARVKGFFKKLFRG
jgi:hypothetical protein